MLMSADAITGLGLTIALVGVAVVLVLFCLGVVLLSRHYAARREHDLHLDLQEQRLDIERREQRLAERESRLDEETAHLRTQQEEAASASEERRQLLEQTASMTADEARQELLSHIEHDARLQGALLARDIEKCARDEAEHKARRLLATVIQRLPAEQTSDSTVSVVQLPSDDMKGRIIGREGRNIRAFEQITGVNVVIDDTPESVVLSCFDPVRREVARLALESLVADGRIHPTRIEEAHRRSQDEVEALCRKAGEEACVGMGITDLHPELVLTMGRLHYRTSYGQNVLKHLEESGHAAGL